MSIISLINDSEKNTIWLGSNGRATIGSFVAPSVDHKWVAIHGWLVGITGTGPKVEALKAHDDDFPKDAEHPFKVMKFMKSAYEAYDIGETDEGLKRYCGSGLLAHKSGRAWDFDNSFCLTEIPANTFWARGSGMDIAIGAADVLTPFVRDARERLARALEVTIARDVDCPGEPLVQQFDREGKLHAAV
ncbi:MAG: hypothetical protein KJN99_14310 [Marinicaulis sp.]|nr:hypothetical protein [Marinicaulis sp.]